VSRKEETFAARNLGIGASVSGQEFFFRSVAFMRQGDRKRSELLQPHAAQQAQRHLEALVRADLRKSSYDEVGRVTCTLHERVLTLSGRVSTYYLKQIAQRIALDRLKGAGTVVNELRVEP
jgi:osmotically-inducible protein OsmY